MHCSPDKCDELKRALSALRSSKSHWKKKDWIEAVSLNIRTCDWGAVSHGGDRRSGGCHRSPGSSSEQQGASTLISTPHQQPSAFGDVLDHAASPCDAASVPRVHTKNM